MVMSLSYFPFPQLSVLSLYSWILETDSPTNLTLVRSKPSCVKFLFLLLCWWLNFSDLDWPGMTYPVLSCPSLSCPDQSWPVLTSPDLSWPVPTCPDLSRPVLTFPNLSWPVQFLLVLNRAKCLLMNLFVKFKVIELLTQLKIYIFSGKGKNYVKSYLSWLPSSPFWWPFSFTSKPFWWLS